MEKKWISQSTAEMVRTATISFHILGYPNYYQDFLTALQITISKVARFTGHDTEEAQRILRLLTPR
jgi:hypothetical protein